MIQIQKYELQIRFFIAFNFEHVSSHSVNVVVHLKQNLMEHHQLQHTLNIHIIILRD